MEINLSNIKGGVGRGYIYPILSIRRKILSLAMENTKNVLSSLSY